LNCNALSHRLSIPDEETRFRRLVELNVREQCLNVLKTPNVQQHMRKHGYPRVHGMVYDISEGLLRELDLEFEQYVGDFQHIYAVGKGLGQSPQPSTSPSTSHVASATATSSRTPSQWVPPSPVRPGDSLHFGTSARSFL